ncbi:MAG TPA: AarF/UbiB family protein [Candidatus Methylacidiphilales bacterium]|nr:AarF/UbiB family protein [Candidatus Methylacidiphilales bacterium]
MLAEVKSAVGFAHLLPRYREIIQILWKHGFGEILKLVVLQKIVGMDEKALNEKTAHEELLPVRVRMALEELGPTFIKFGQVLSSRRDLISNELYVELCKLHDRVPPFDGELAQEIVETELGKPVKQLFSSFSTKAAAGASIAQVHIAKLKDGAKVAVKVQRPDIRKVIDLDLAILHDLARFTEKNVTDLSGMNPVGVVEEFSDTILKELDFTHEADNAARYRTQFRRNRAIKVPKVYEEYSTSRVLTLEFISGLSITDPVTLRRHKIDPVGLAERLADLIYEQVLDFGFFHGDPHPGNLCVLPKGVVGVMDFGMMGRFAPSLRASIANLLAGLARKDHPQVMNAILEISKERYAEDSDKMLADVEAFADLHLSQSLKDINLGEVLNKLLALLHNNRLRMNGSFYLGIKALTQVEAIGRILDPDINFVERGEPYARPMIERKYQFPHLIEIANRVLTGGIDFVEHFPTDFRNLYQRFKAGKLTIPIEHRIDPDGFDPMRQTMHSIANLLATAVLTASVLICSSILVLAAMPPMVWGVSLFGFLGLAWGTTMGLRLAIHVWRHGGL